MANLQILPLFSKQTTITKGIHQKFHLAHLGMITCPKDVNYVSVTCDAWSSPFNTSMLGVRAHCMNPNFVPVSVTLALKEIHGLHNSSNLALVVQDTLEQ